MAQGVLFIALGELLKLRVFAFREQSAGGVPKFSDFPDRSTIAKLRLFAKLVCSFALLPAFAFSEPFFNACYRVVFTRSCNLDDIFTRFVRFSRKLRTQNQSPILGGGYDREKHWKVPALLQRLGPQSVKRRSKKEA